MAQKSNKAHPVNDGDWICSDKDCGNINFAWRSSCNKCGKDKGKVEVFKKTGSEIGKAAATKSGGLFSAEDWQCSMCGNVNWARRNECNICNAPKFGTVEPRTGAGGGYNERDGVEYVEREDSDEEFDEFGRKKKKFRGKVSSSSEAVKPKENKEKGDNGFPSFSDLGIPSSTTHFDEEEEEEEDSGEEVDLSKYDLIGDDEDDDDNDKEKEQSSKMKESRRRSRSRSRSRSRDRSHGGGRYRRSSRSRSRSPRSGRSRSRSRSPERSKKRRSSRSSRSRSRERSRSPRRKKRTRGSRSRSRSRSRSHSRDRDRDKGRKRRSRSRSHDRSRDRRSKRSRSRSKERRRSYRSRSRSRDRDRHR